jgi:hypothetical protein
MGIQDAASGTVNYLTNFAQNAKNSVVKLAEAAPHNANENIHHPMNFAKNVAHEIEAPFVGVYETIRHPEITLHNDLVILKAAGAKDPKAVRDAEIMHYPH